jgi:hypothetical protein
MRLVVLVLGGAVLLVALAMQTGHVSPPAEIIERLANRPEVGGQFADPSQGRFDATVFLFTCIILTPIATLALALSLAIVMMTLEGTVFPLSRKVGLPDRVTVVFVTAVLVSLAWTRAELWLPRSLRLIGTIARAWVISST